MKLQWFIRHKEKEILFAHCVCRLGVIFTHRTILGVERSFSVLGIALMLRVFKQKGFAFNGEKGGADGDHHSSEEGPERGGAKPGGTAKSNKEDRESKRK